MPLIVNHTECSVTVLHRIGNDAQREQIVDLVEPDLLPLHLLENGVSPLHAAFHSGRDAFARQVHFHLVAHLVQELFILLALRFDFAHQFGGSVRLQILKRKILQLSADFAHSEAVRDGRVDFQRLLRDALLAVARQKLQSPHVVQPVRQLDDDDANVVHHGEQHLADALGLPFLA